MLLMLVGSTSVEGFYDYDVVAVGKGMCMACGRRNDCAVDSSSYPGGRDVFLVKGILECGLIVQQEFDMVDFDFHLLILLGL